MADLRLAVVIGGEDKASGPIGHIISSIGGLGRAASSARGHVGGLVDSLGRVGLAGLGFDFVRSGAEQLADMLGLRLNSEVENVEARLLAFTKDGAKAKDILAQIREEADKTPFAFQEMAQATAGLMPAARMANEDLMSLVRTAEILAASNPEQGLTGAAFALREAVSGDFVSIVERFNLPRQYINQLKEQGVPALKVVRMAMLAMGYDADLVSNLAKTGTGRWSTLVDTISGIRRKVGENLFEGLKSEMTNLQSWLDENKTQINEFATGAGQNIGNFARNVGIGFREAVGWFRSLPPEAQRLAIVFGGLIVAGPPLVAVLGLIGGALGMLLSPLGLVAAGAAALTVAWQNNWGGIQQITAAGADWVIDRLGGLSDWWDSNATRFGAAWQNVLRFAGQLWADYGGTVMGILGDVWGFVQNTAGRIVGTIGDMALIVASIITGDWQGAWQAAQRIVGRAWEAIIDLISGGAKIVVRIVGAVEKAFGAERLSAGWVEAIDEMVAKGKNLTANLGTVAEGTNEAADNIGGGAQRIRDSIKGLGDKFAPLAEGEEEVAKGAKKAASALPNLGSAATGAKGPIDALKDALGKAKDRLKELASTPILGERQFDQRAFSIEQRIKGIELRIVNLKLAKAPARSIKPLEDQLEQLRLQADKVDLEKALKYDPLHRQLNELAEDYKELPFGRIIEGIREQRLQIAQLEPRLEAATKQYGKLTSQLYDTEQQAKRTASALSDTAKAAGQISWSPVPAPTRPAPERPIEYFERGGSFLVGGAGGPDSQLVRFWASPGERVDVMPAGQANGSRPYVAQINGPLIGELHVHNEADENRIIRKLHDMLFEDRDTVLSQGVV